MKSKTQWRGALALVGLLTVIAAGAVVAVANSGIVNNDKRVKLSQVPAAVRQTILEHAKRGDIEKIKRSREDGKVVYEVDVDGRSGDYEFVVAEDGKYLGVDHEDEGDHEEMDRDQNHRGRAVDEENEDADASEQVTVISINAAPRAIRDAFKERADGAQPTRVERIVDEGATKYEIEYAADRGTASMTFTDRGEIMEVETPVRIKDLPEAIRKKIMTEYPGAKIEEADAVQAFYYEMDVVVDGEKIEVAAFATGDIEDHLVGGDEENNREGNRKEQDND